MHPRALLDVDRQQTRLLGQQWHIAGKGKARSITSTVFFVRRYGLRSGRLAGCTTFIVCKHQSRLHPSDVLHSPSSRVQYLECGSAGIISHPLISILRSLLLRLALQNAPGVALKVLQSLLGLVLVLALVVDIGRRWLLLLLAFLALRVGRLAAGFRCRHCVGCVVCNLALEV